MKHATHVLCLAGLALLTACGEEEATWPPVRTDMGWLTTSPAGRADRFMPDSGDTLRVSNVQGGLQPDSLYRVIAIHTPAGGTTAVNRIEPLLVATPRAYKNPKTDPVEAISVWEGGGCVNLRLGIRTRNAGTHYFGCIDYGTTTWPDRRKTLTLGLYHDQGTDPPSFTRTLYLSFGLTGHSPALQPGDTVRVRIPTFTLGTDTRTVVLAE